MHNELSSFSGKTSSVDAVSNSKKPTVRKKHFKNAQSRKPGKKVSAKPFGGHNNKDASSSCQRCGYSQAVVIHKNSWGQYMEVQVLVAANHG